MNTSPDVQLVCFDLGGVLVRICHSWPEAAELAGVPDLMPLDEPRVAAGVKRVLLEFELGRVDRAGLVERIIDLSRGYEPTHITAIVEGWLKDPYPGSDVLVERIRAAGIPTACLSNTNAWHWEVMSDRERFPALWRLDHRFASHLSRARKPDAAFYQALESELAVDPRSIVFFDDLPENVEAAGARGWRAHVITPDRDPVAQMTERLTALGVFDASHEAT